MKPAAADRSADASATTPLAIARHGQGFAFGVKAQPRARREGIVGIWNGSVRVAVREPAENGRANEAIVAVLADALRVRRDAIALVAGAASSRKRFAVAGLPEEQIAARLRGAIPIADGA